MLAGGLLPFLLGVDAIVPFFASHQTKWSRVIDERVHATAAAMASPKVVFVGGSNVTFAINPRSLSARLGVPVIAYGVNAGIGLDLIVARARTLIGPGDLVVLMPEIAHFRSDRATDPALRGDWISLFGNPVGDPIGRAPRRTWIAARERCRRAASTADNLVVGQVLALRSSWRRIPVRQQPPGPYDVRSIGPEGNCIAPRPAPTIVVKGVPLVRATEAEWLGSLGVRGVRRMGDACRAVDARWCVLPGAIWTLADPPHPGLVSQMRQDEERLLALAASLGAEPLLPAGSSLLVGPYGFDTINHLNDRGVALLEDRLAPALATRLAR